MPCVLLIVGKGPCWAEDVAAFKAFGVEHDVLGVNDAALWLPETPKYAFSYHPTIMDRVKEQRPEVVTYSLMPSCGVDHYIRMRGETGGSSSYLAARLAVDYLGYPRIVLAGVPLSGQYFLDFVPQWVAGRDYLKGRVRSMCGATGALLGKPCKEWLNDGE